MNEREPLRQQIWELVYGLLEPDEVASLHARIKSDPVAARLYSEVRLQADLVSDAAKVNDPSVVLAPMAGSGKGKSPKGGKPSPRSTTTPNRAGVNWLAAVAAIALALLIAVSLLITPPSASDLLPRFVVAEVDVPSQLPAGLTQSMAVRTTNVEDQAQPAEVELRVIDASGRERFRDSVKTDAQGQANVEIPGRVVQGDVRVEVAAAPVARFRRGDAVPSPVSVEASVQDEPVASYVLVDKPSYVPGESVHFAYVKVSRFTKQPVVAAGDELTVQVGSGAAIVKPEITSTSGNLITGAFMLPETNAPGPQSLAFNERQGAAGPQHYFFQLKQSVAPAADQLALQDAGGFGRRMQRESFDAEKLTDRFAEKSAAKEVPQTRAKALTDDAVDDALPALSGASEAPAAAPRGELRGDDLAEGVQPIQRVTAGRPIEVSIPADLADRPLLVTATCANVVVASQDVAPSEAAGENARQVDLTPPPEADGEILVTVADRSDPATPLVQRQFFREPIKRLNLRVSGADRTFQPGERVALDVDVLNEQDEPESALLGVRVWYDQAIPRQGEPATLVASVLGTETNGPLPAPTTLAAASNFYRFSQAAGAAGAAAPAQEPPSDRQRQSSYSGAIPTDESATLGDGGVVQPAVRTVSNRGEVRALYEQSVAHSAAIAAERKEWFGRALLFGGLAVLVLLGLQALARLSARTAIWIPAATVAVASAVLGLAWLNPSWQGSVENETLIAQAPEAERSRATFENHGRLKSQLESHSDAARAVDEGLQADKAPAPTAGPPAADAAAAPDFSKPMPQRGLAPDDMPADAVVGQKNPPARTLGESFGAPANAAAPPPSPEPKPAEARSTRSAAIPKLASGGAPPALPAASAPIPASESEKRQADKGKNAAPAAESLARVDRKAMPKLAQEPLSAAADVKQRGALSRNEAAEQKSAEKETAKKDNDAARQSLGLEANSKANEPAVPVTLLFEPSLHTDDQGRATIEFSLPDTPSDYRVLIDALGHGRIGSTELLIKCRPADADAK